MFGSSDDLSHHSPPSNFSTNPRSATLKRKSLSGLSSISLSVPSLRGTDDSMFVSSVDLDNRPPLPLPLMKTANTPRGKMLRPSWSQGEAGGSILSTRPPCPVPHSTTYAVPKKHIHSHSATCSGTGSSEVGWFLNTILSVCFAGMTLSLAKNMLFCIV